MEEINSTQSGSGLKFLCGYSVNVAQRRGGNMFFISGRVLDVVDGFIRIEDKTRCEQLISLASCERIEFRGRAMTPDRPPWKQSGDNHV